MRTYRKEKHTENIESIEKRRNIETRRETQRKHKESMDHRRHTKTPWKLREQLENYTNIENMGIVRVLQIGGPQKKL